MESIKSMEYIKSILSKFIKDESVISKIVTPKTISYWERAVTHESVNYNEKENYEKLEFLGDGLLVEVELELGVLAALQVADVEVVVVETSDEGVAIRGKTNVELVEDDVLFVDVVEFGVERLKELDGLDGFLGLALVPHFSGQVVAGYDLGSISGEFEVGD